MNWSPRLLLPMAYMAALLLLSSVPGDTTADDTVGAVFLWVPPTLQNLLHIPLYAGLFLSWWWALGRQRPLSAKQFVAAILVSLAWAVVDETWQRFVPGRYGSFTDLSLNALGVGLAAVFARPRDLVQPSD